MGSLDHKVCVFEDKSICGPWGGAGDWRMAQTMHDHRHYVQGVSYDPRGVYVATQGSDRTVNVFPRKQAGKGRKAPAKKVAVLAESTKANEEEGAKQPLVEAQQQQQQQGVGGSDFPDTVAGGKDTENDADKARSSGAQQPNPPPPAVVGQQQPPPSVPEVKFELLKAKQVKEGASRKE